MSDYTLTTERMREVYVTAGEDISATVGHRHRDEFDCWLADIERAAYLRGRADEFDAYARGVTGHE